MHLPTPVNAIRKDSSVQLIGDALINHEKKCFIKDIDKLLILKYIHESLNIAAR